MRLTIVRVRSKSVAGEGTETASLEDAARARLRDAGIGYVRLVTCNENTEMAFRRLFERAKQSRARALILDLRGNGGGRVGVSLRVGDWFVPAGQALLPTGDRGGGGGEGHGAGPGQGGRAGGGVGEGVS